MSFAGVSFFSISGVSRSTNTIPVFSTIAAEAATAAGTSTLTPVLTWAQVKVRRDTGDQVLQLPVALNDIENFESCNVAVISFSQYRRWYWITGYTEITNSAYPNGVQNTLSYQVQLEYIPVTTSISLTQSTVDILPERKPTATARMMQNWTESIMLPVSTSTALPSLPKIGTVKKVTTSGSAQCQVLWCEVTLTEGNSIYRHGLFITAKSGNGINGTNVFAGSYNQVSRKEMYPTLQQLLQDPLTYLNRPTATVTDVNISEFCPYETIKANTTDANEEYIVLKTNNGSMYGPNNTYTNGASYYYAFPLYSTEFAEPGNSEAKINSGSISITLTDFEKNNGQLFIKDSLRNDVMMINKDMLDNTVTINYRVYSDSSNIYTTFEFAGGIITLSGYKIPWATSMWDQYRAYSLQFDRQALQNNIDAANRELDIALTDAAANGIIGGTLAGALTRGPAGAALGLFTGASSFASSMISGTIRRDETVRKLQRDQELTEQRMRAGPGTMNNISANSGVINSINSFGGASLMFKMPDGFTATQWGDQTSAWGYPSNKVLTSGTLSEGYWKGRIMKALTNIMNNTDKGEAFDRLVDQVDGGVRLKKVL